MSAPLIHCTALTVGYGGKPMLPPIDCQIGRGEFWCIVGRNGSGKSTWFKTVLGLERPVEGEVTIADGVRLSYVRQRSGFDELWPVTASQVVAMGMERGASFLRPLTDRKRVAAALEAVDATDLGGRAFRSLSEGQKQRVLLARVVASGADVAFLDEPTAAMDDVAEREAFELLNDVRKRYHTTIVVVSHYLGVAREMSDHVLFVDREMQHILVGNAEEVFGNPVFQARYEGIHA